MPRCTRESISVQIKWLNLQTSACACTIAKIDQPHMTVELFFSRGLSLVDFLLGLKAKNQVDGFLSGELQLDKKSVKKYPSQIA